MLSLRVLATCVCLSVCAGQGTCLQDQFTCVSGECISQSLYCDGAVNCSDGSDEVNCRSECVQEESLRHSHNLVATGHSTALGGILGVVGMLTVCKCIALHLITINTSRSWGYNVQNIHMAIQWLWNLAPCLSCLYRITTPTKALCCSVYSASCIVHAAVDKECRGVVGRGGKGHLR